MPVSFCFPNPGHRAPETELISGYSLPMKIGLVGLWIEYFMERIKDCTLSSQLYWTRESDRTRQRFRKI